MFPDRFNLAQYLLEHNLEAGRGGKVALRWRDEEHTYAGLSTASNRLAHAFTDLGLRQEERVLIALSDRPEFSHAWFATLKCGAVFAMVNTLLTEEDYAYYLEYTRARIAVIDERLAPLFARLASSARHLRTVVVADGDASLEGAGRGGGASDPATAPVAQRAARRPPQLLPGQIALTELIRQAADAPVMADTHRHDLAGWLFTSGSTGQPKAAVHFHEDFAFNIEHYAKGVLGIRESDVTAGVPKLFFGYATGTDLMFPFAVGGSTALFSERSTPENVFAVVERYRPTILTSVPTMIGKMLALEAEDVAAGRPRRDLSSLRLVLSAGEKLPEALQKQWLARCGVEILDGIGSAELFHIYVSNRPGAVRIGSLGQAVPGYDCQVVDPEGRPVPAGQVGRLHVRGESSALCYWQDHAKSKETFAGDLVITGDMFRIDDEGYFWYEGRADELLKVGGVWVSPNEIENCLLEHPAVAEAAVVGWTDADELVKPKAFVVPRAGRGPRAGEAAAAAAFAAELQGWVRSRLAPYKYPRWVELLAELPKNDRGKVDRKSLRRRHGP
ncbi:MAG TPA: benzoate-CoA ligase family protein [Planctomycetota bacterium]|nr:benzoate-CoA ligase family protein [Planctomycetota bacterium]